MCLLPQIGVVARRSSSDLTISSGKSNILVSKFLFLSFILLVFIICFHLYSRFWKTVISPIREKVTRLLPSFLVNFLNHCAEPRMHYFTPALDRQMYYERFMFSYATLVRVFSFSSSYCIVIPLYRSKHHHARKLSSLQKPTPPPVRSNPLQQCYRRRL